MRIRAGTWLWSRGHVFWVLPAQAEAAQQCVLLPSVAGTPRLHPPETQAQTCWSSQDLSQEAGALCIGAP